MAKAKTHFALPGYRHSVCGMVAQFYKTSAVPSEVTCAYCRRYNLTARAAAHARDTKLKD